MGQRGAGEGRRVGRGGGGGVSRIVQSDSDSKFSGIPVGIRACNPSPPRSTRKVDSECVFRGLHKSAVVETGVQVVLEG